MRSNSLKEKRRERKLTQQQLADAVGVDASYIPQIESGRKIPSLLTVMLLLDVLDCNFRDLWPRVPQAQQQQIPLIQDNIQDLQPQKTAASADLRHFLATNGTNTQTKTPRLSEAQKREKLAIARQAHKKALAKHNLKPDRQSGKPKARLKRAA